MSGLRPDLCIIGAGSGGLTVAAGAAQLGAKVVLIERGEMGGDCLNAGCVPSKALIAAAAHAHAMTAGAPFGVAPVVPQVDWAGVMAHVRATIAAIAPHDSQGRFEGLGVQVIRAHGRFVSPRAVEAGGQRIEARHVVIATGSRAVAPPVPGLDGVPWLTNETVFAQPDRPAHLIVLGGGPIGIEMAQAHARLGARVTVIEAARALGREDPEAAALVLARLRAEGVEILEDTPAEAVSGSEGAITLTAGGRRIEGTRLLVAAGRAPVTEGMGLDEAGIRVKDGRIVTDGRLRTTNRRVLVIGDAAGGPQFTHLAGWQGGQAVRAALFRLPVRGMPAALPRVTYTDPELAQVGPTEAEARRLHPGLEVLRAEYAGNDRAQAMRATDGFVKLMVARGRVVGATAVGEGAGEIAATLALAVSARLKVGALAGMIAPYPTLGELPRRAAGQYYVPRLFQNPWVHRIVRLIARF